jgi:hypothetical protein
VQGTQIAKIAGEIVRLAQQQLDLLDVIPIHKWTETQQEGYRLRQRRISELCTEIDQTSLSSAA